MKKYDRKIVWPENVIYFEQISTSNKTRKITSKNAVQNRHLQHQKKPTSVSGVSEEEGWQELGDDALFGIHKQFLNRLLSQPESDILSIYRAKFGRSILSKIVDTFASRCQISRQNEAYSISAEAPPRTPSDHVTS